MSFNEPLDNPYNENVQDYRSETPTMDRVIQKGIDKNLLRMHTCLPAVVTEVLSPQRVTVTPLLYKRHVDPSGESDMGILVPIESIGNVPVQMPSGSLYYFKGPIQVGDTGMLVFSERSLDVWKSSTGEIVDPGDPRHHDISDGVFVPGVVPFSNQISDDTTDIVISNGPETGQVRLTQEGDILLGTSSAESPAVLGDVLMNGLSALVSALNNLAMVLGTGPIGVIGTPSPGSPVLTSPGVIAAVATFSTALTAFTTQYLTTPATNIVSEQTFLERGE